MAIQSEFFNAKYFLHQYTFCLPPLALDRDVEYFWQSDFRENLQETGERVFANLSTSFVFNLGTPFYYNAEGGQRQAIDRSVLVGMRSLPAVFEHQQQNLLFGVKFKPGALTRFFDLKISDLKNEVVELSGLVNKEGLLTALQTAANFSERIQLFSDFLKKRANPLNYQAEMVDQTLRLFQQQYTQSPKVYQYAKQLFVSPKSLTRYFQNILGMNPKTCMNILRLRDALRQFTNSQRDFSVYDFGYTDYSHFLKEVKKYTKTIPSQLR